MLVRDESSVNIPAIAAAHAIKRYVAQAPDELSFEVSSSRHSLLPCTEEHQVEGISNILRHLQNVW